MSKQLTDMDVADQQELLSDYIIESTEYYIICDECRGTFDLEASNDGNLLYEQGWRLRENAVGREFTFCPKCATTATQLEG